MKRAAPTATTATLTTDTLAALDASALAGLDSDSGQLTAIAAVGLLTALHRRSSAPC